jgi:hypothetical protein
MALLAITDVTVIDCSGAAASTMANALLDAS